MSIRSVLVIDDNPTVREQFKRNLRSPNLKVISALNAKYGMEELKRTSFDCVFCDLIMPIISGEEVLAHILENYPTTPVIMMAEYGKTASAVDLVKKGAFDYLAKPVAKEVMLQTVKRAGEHKASLEEERHRVQELSQRELQHASERETLQERLKELRDRIITQCEFVNKLNCTESMRPILEQVESYTKSVIRCKQAVSMLLKDEEPADRELDEFIEEILQNLIQVPERVFSVPDASREPLRKLLSDKIASIYDNARVEAVLPEIHCPTDETNLRRSLYVPLAANNVPLGVMILFEEQDRERDYSEQEKLQLLFIAEAASTAIHNCQKSHKLIRGYLDTVTALTLAVEAKDKYTRGHSKRVQERAVQMARVMNLPQDQVELLGIAGSLHDVGKIGVPLDIINKQQRLNQREFSIIKNHPAAGDKMIRHIKFFEPIREIIRHHHERFDGRGYPDRLAGEEISVCARILTVADSYDAMTSDRPYRKALSAYEAYLELERNAGTQFDPKCVAALGRVLRDEMMQADVAVPPQASSQ